MVAEQNVGMRQLGLEVRLLRHPVDKQAYVAFVNKVRVLLRAPCGARVVCVACTAVWAHAPSVCIPLRHSRTGTAARAWATHCVRHTAGRHGVQGCHTLQARAARVLQARGG
jgi:hypothetical protein